MMRLFAAVKAYAFFLSLVGQVQTNILGPGTPMRIFSTNSTSEQAARVALLAIRASLPESMATGEHEVVIMPSLTSLSEDGAIRVLSGLDKPVRCGGRSMAARLTIECTTLVGAAVPELVRASVREAQDLVKAIQSRYCHNSPSALIQIRGAKRSLVVPLPILIEYLRDYHVMGETFVEPPDEEAIQLGACAVLVMRGTGYLEGPG